MKNKLVNHFRSHRVNTLEDNNVDYDNTNIYAMRYKIKQLEAQLKLTKKNLLQKIKDVATYQLNIFGDWDLVISEYKLDKIFNPGAKDEITSDIAKRK